MTDEQIQTCSASATHKLFDQVRNVHIRCGTRFHTSACLPLPVRRLSSQSFLRQTTRTLLTLEEHPNVAGLGAVSLVLLAIDQSMGGLDFGVASAVALVLLGTVVGLDLRGSGHFRLTMVDRTFGICSCWRYVLFRCFALILEVD